MKKQLINKYRLYLLISVIYLGLFLLLFQRMLMSVELTDEIHGIASIYNIYLGKVPFITSWDYHTGWCLLAPLFGIFRMFSPNLEGCVLFFRCIYITFAFIMFFLSASILYKKIYNNIVFFLTLTSLFYVSSSLFQVNYNSFTVYSLILVSVLLYSSDQEKDKKFFLIGIIMGLVCITYPTFIVVSVLLATLVFIEHKNDYWKEKMAYYCLGGCIIAVAFLSWIFLSGEDISLFFKALNGMFSSPHEKSKGSINLAFLIQTFYKPMKDYFFRIYSIIWIIFAFLQWIILKKAKRHNQLWSGLVFTILLILNVWYEQDKYGYLLVGDLIGLMLLISLRGNKIWNEYRIFFSMLFLYIFTYSFTSDNKNIMVAFETAGPFVFFIISVISGVELLKDYYSFGVAIALVLSLSGIAHIYTYVYRDAPVMQLTEHVDHGIYKGLYTTQSRKYFVEEIEDVLMNNIMPNDSICTVTRAPMVYLMSKAQICAPQTWDAQFLARGYISSLPLTEYFEAIGEIPDVLVATDMDISDFYDNPKYEINRFIMENYELYYSGQIEETHLYLWRKCLK